MELRGIHYQRKVHEGLHAVAWAHVGHVVEVGRVRDHLGPQLWVSQHLPDKTKTNKFLHKNKLILIQICLNKTVCKQTNNVCVCVYSMAVHKLIN